MACGVGVRLGAPGCLGLRGFLRAQQRGDRPLLPRGLALASHECFQVYHAPRTRRPACVDALSGRRDGACSVCILSGKSGRWCPLSTVTRTPGFPRSEASCQQGTHAEGAADGACAGVVSGAGRGPEAPPPEGGSSTVTAGHTSPPTHGDAWREGPHRPLEELAWESCARREPPRWTLTSWANKTQGSLVLSPARRPRGHTPIVSLLLPSGNRCWAPKRGPSVWLWSAGVLGCTPESLPTRGCCRGCWTPYPSKVLL